MVMFYTLFVGIRTDAGIVCAALTMKILHGRVFSFFPVL